MKQRTSNGPYKWTDLMIEDMRNHNHLTNQQLADKYGVSVKAIETQKHKHKIFTDHNKKREHI